jgi:GNAT superfamily N-acetyltransferase
MTRIVVRETRPGDGRAIARIHADMARYYLELAPEYFQMPALDGFAEELDAEAATIDSATLRLVAGLDGEVVGALLARLLPPEDTAARQISRDLTQPRLRIDYIAAAQASRRQGAGSRLVEAAEAWGWRAGAKIGETWTYHRSPLSAPFWTDRMGYEERSINLRKPL